MDKNALRSAARVVRDDQGNLVVQIPLALWEAAVDIADERPQHERIRSVLAAWQEEPQEESEAWWDAFDKDLKSSRLNLKKSDRRSEHS